MKVIEEREEQAWKIATSLPNALVIHGDGTDIDLLTEEGLPDMDAFVAVTGDDEKNIITTLLARHSHVPHQISLVNKVEYLPIMPTIGLDTVVSKQLLTVSAVQRLVQYQQVASIASLPGINGQFIEYVAPNEMQDHAQVPARRTLPAQGDRGRCPARRRGDDSDRRHAHQRRRPCGDLRVAGGGRRVGSSCSGADATGWRGWGGFKEFEVQQLALNSWTTPALNLEPRQR